MGRPAKLTDKQWASVIKRVLVGGEKPADLAREFGITLQAVRKKLVHNGEPIKVVAKQIVEAESGLDRLDFSSQVTAMSYAEKLRNTLYHASSAAEYGAMTAHQLSGLAFAQSQKIRTNTDGNIDHEKLKTVAMLTDVSNKANEPAIKLISTLKDQMQDEDRAKRLYDLILQEVDKASPEVARDIAKNISKLDSELNNHLKL